MADCAACRCTSRHPGHACGRPSAAASALESVPASVTNVDVVELEPEVIEANRQISAMRDVDPLADPRFIIVINGRAQRPEADGQDL